MKQFRVTFSCRDCCAFQGAKPSQPLHGVSVTLIAGPPQAIVYLNPVASGGVVHSSQFQFNMAAAAELYKALGDAISHARLTKETDDGTKPARST